MLFYITLFTWKKNYRILDKPSRSDCYGLVESSVSSFESQARPPARLIGGSFLLMERRGAFLRLCLFRTATAGHQSPSPPHIGPAYAAHAARRNHAGGRVAPYPPAAVSRPSSAIRNTHPGCCPRVGVEHNSAARSLLSRYTDTVALRDACSARPVTSL